MRAFLGLFIAALISAVSASMLYPLYPRAVPGYPACAQGCLANATSSKCQPGEVQCLCEDTTFVTSTNTCFEGNCNGTDLTAAQKAARDNCALAGVTLTSSGTSSATAASSSSTSNSNSAESTMVNTMGAAAALGLAVLAL